MQILTLVKRIKQENKTNQNMKYSSIHDMNYYPGQKKAPSRRFAVRRTLFDLVISCLITSDQRRTRSSTRLMTIHDFCPALIARDRAGYRMMEQRSSCRESPGWFFLLLSRVVRRFLLGSEPMEQCSGQLF